VGFTLKYNFELQTAQVQVSPPDKNSQE